MPFKSASPSLGPSVNGSRPASARALAAGIGSPFDEDLARPDHRGGHVRQGGQVARCARRALGRHDRDQIVLEQGLEHGDRFRPDAGGALGQARQLERHHQPNDRRGRRLAHAGRMRQHDVALQGLEVAGRDPDARQFAEAGVDSVDRLALGHDPLDGVGTATDRGAAAGIDRQRGAAIDGAPVRERDEAGPQQNGRHCPLQTRA